MFQQKFIRNLIRYHTLSLILLFFALSLNNLSAQEQQNNTSYRSIRFPQDSLSKGADLRRPEQQLRLDIMRFLGRTSIVFFGAATTRYSPNGIPSLVESNDPITLVEAQWGFTATLGHVVASLHLARNGWEVSPQQNPNNKLSNRPITNDMTLGYKVWEHQGFSITPCFLSGETWRSLEQDRLKITYLNSLGGEVNFSYTLPISSLYLADKSIPEIEDAIEAVISLRIGYAQHFTSDNSGRLFAPFANPAHQEFSARLVVGIGFSTLFVGAR